MNLIAKMDKLLNAQFVFFPSNFNLTQKDRANFISKFSNVFKGNQLILPIPDSAPDDILRMSINSEDNDYRVNFAKNRIDVVFEPLDDDRQEIPLESLLGKHYSDNIRSIFEILSNEKTFSFGKIGFVIRSILDENDIENKIFNFIDSKSKSLFDIQYDDADLTIKHSRKEEIKLKDTNFQSNILFTISSGLKDLQTHKRLAMFEFDSNLLDDPNNLYKWELYQEFIEITSKRNNELLQKIKSIIESSDQNKS